MAHWKGHFGWSQTPEARNFVHEALEYKEYFTHIAVQQMTKSSRDIQDFLVMKFRIFDLAVSEYMIVTVCVMFWRHLTPCSKDYFVRISMVAFIWKGG
jgi:hypothetical protein